ncbi:hypothetical protein MNBD_GAMMA16-484 [hydrothermal vent metagenome]|uniref:Cyclic nucleotide-binding domain-containing protein n=1 Tax=hydrothermal vent metagenome TaxID=652676 RepID=A0A3B0ZP76_9ZZZZ
MTILLSNMPVFGGVDNKLLQYLLDHCPRKRLSQGEYFFREDENAKAMYVLQYGQVRVEKRWRDRTIAMRTLGEGDCFGEMALIDLYPRSASVVALEDSEALEIEPSLLASIYEHDQQAFTIIYMNMAREISRRLRDTDRRYFESSMMNKTGDYEANIQFV